jgi:uncharacterized membrane protein
MENQNYANHRRIIPLFHVVTFFTIVLLIVGAVVNLCMSFGNHDRLYSASLILIISIILIFFFFFFRGFALRAQDRAIRSEENLRHFVLTGKLLDKKLSIRQVIALRFASDEEFVELATKAAASDMKPNEIKQAIKNWKGDYHRV